MAQLIHCLLPPAGAPALPDKSGVWCCGKPGVCNSFIPVPSGYGCREAGRNNLSARVPMVNGGSGGHRLCVINNFILPRVREWSINCRAVDSRWLKWWVPVQPHWKGWVGNVHSCTEEIPLGKLLWVAGCCDVLGYTSPCGKPSGRYVVLVRVSAPHETPFHVQSPGKNRWSLLCSCPGQCYEMLPSPGDAQEWACCTPPCAPVPLQHPLGNPSIFLTPTVPPLLCQRVKD